MRLIGQEWLVCKRCQVKAFCYCIRSFLYYFTVSLSALDFFPFIGIFFCVCMVCVMCIYGQIMYKAWATGRGLRTVLGSWTFPSIFSWILEIEPRLSSLKTLFPAEPSPRLCGVFSFFYLFVCLFFETRSMKLRLAPNLLCNQSWPCTSDLHSSTSQMVGLQSPIPYLAVVYFL